jgi:putative hydrolase of HD superfamily
MDKERGQAEMVDERLKRQIGFICEIDRLKNILRRTYLMDNSRHENAAEHSWHLAVMALLMSGYSTSRQIDTCRVLKMLLVHDIVEIDAGDTFCYDEEGQRARFEKETRAADRLFSLLPEDQACELRALWEEFEEMETTEAKFAASLDRLQPLLCNYRTEGFAWRENRITSKVVFDRNEHIKDAAPRLWEFAEDLITDAVEKGYLPR